MKHYLYFAALFVSCLSLSARTAWAQGAVVGLDTNGIIYQIDHKTATLTEKTEEVFNSFVLGGTTRLGGKFYYVAEPSGLTQNAIYTMTLETSALSHIALDRDDQVRALFKKGRKLYGVLYDGNAGTAGVYEVNPITGVTTLILDLSDLNVEPIAGSISLLNGYFYMLVKPEANSDARQLLRFKARSGAATRLSDVLDVVNAPVLCDKLKPNLARNNFVCMASASSETQVNVCRLALSGRATCLSTLADIERVGSGHTMLSSDGRNYYAFVYAPDEENNQRLIKFNGRGVLKSNTPISTIIIGAHFQNEASVSLN